MRVLAPVLVLLLGALGAWWFTSRDGPAAPPGGVDAADSGATHAAAGVESADAPATDAQLPAPAHAAERLEVLDDAPTFPLPADAEWVEVRIVDAATEEPVPDAEVLWNGRAQHRHVRELPLAKRDRMTADAARIADRFGWRTRSDDHGVARVAVDGSYITVLARKDDRFGITSFGADVADGDRVVRLEPDVTLRVRVSTADGAVAGGVPVQLLPRDPARPEAPAYFGAVERTDEEGVATFEHAQKRQRWTWGPDRHGPVPLWRLTAGMRQTPLSGEAVDVDAQAPPTEPVDLTLGPTGALHVRLLYMGEPARAVGEASLHVKRLMLPGEFPRSWTEAVDDDGWLRFGFVPPAQTFTLTHYPWHLEVDGPTSAGVVARRTIDLAEELVVLAGRTLDQDGNPVPAARFYVTTRLRLATADDSRLDHSLFQVDTDADGRFVAPLARPSDGETVTLVDLELTRHVDGKEAAKAHAPEQPLRKGRNDLGDLRLDAGRLLCAGRVVFDHEPKPSLTLFVQRHDAERAEGDRWRPADGLMVDLRDDGAFTVRGAFEPGRYRLGATNYSNLPVEPIEFTPGADDLEVAVRVGTRITANLLLPPSLDPNRLTVTVTPEQPTGDDDAAARIRRQGYVTPGDERGEAQASLFPQPPGTYTLRIVPRTSETPLHEQQVVLTGEHAELELAEIDLRDARTVTVHLTLPDVAAQRWSWAILGVLPPVDGTLLGTRGMQGANVVPVREVPCELFVVGVGLAPQRVQVTGPEVHVTMRARPTATVQVTGVTELPAGCSLEARARPLTAPTTIAERYKYDWGSGDLAHFAPTDTEPVEVVGGRAELALLDGAHDLEFWLVAGEQRRRLTRTSVTRIPGPGAYVVELSADEVAGR